jgi:hypothetical protein
MIARACGQGTTSYILTSVFCSMASLRYDAEVAITHAYSQRFGHIVISFGFVGQENCSSIALRRCGARGMTSFGKTSTKESPLRWASGSAHSGTIKPPFAALTIDQGASMGSGHRLLHTTDKPFLSHGDSQCKSGAAITRTSPQRFGPTVINTVVHERFQSSGKPCYQGIATALSRCEGQGRLDQLLRYSTVVVSSLP